MRSSARYSSTNLLGDRSVTSTLKLARRVRERLFRELEDEATVGAGAHFPELRFGRVLVGRGRRWFT
jgi:hypothetical protein